jgi:hypothetical protein
MGVTVINRNLFFPMKFRESRPYTKELISKLKDLKQQGKINPQIAYKITASVLAQSLKKAGISERYISENTEALNLFTLESLEAIIWSQWSLSESQLYCFNENLIEAFKNSSALELSINNLKFPFENSYFHFGTQIEMPLHDGMLFVEGAYVFFNETSLRITLCGTWKEELENKDMLPWHKRGNECYDLRILASNYSLPLEQAIDTALATDIQDLKRSEAQLISQKIPFIESQSSHSFINAHHKNQESYKKAISLITNALCYLTAYPNDDKLIWQHHAPIKLVNLAENGTQKEKIRASSKLKSLGFSIVHQIGEEFSEHFKKSDHEDNSSNRRVHWRRGHWRMQPYGPNHSLRKLIWLTPVMIGMATDINDVSRVRLVD